MPALILWSHALAALLFGGIALAQARGRHGTLPRRAFVAAAALTALWALAVAGIDPRDVSIRLADSARDAAWLVFMIALTGRGRRAGYGLAAVYGVVLLLVATAAVLAVIETVVHRPDDLAALVGTRLLLRMMAALSALVLVQQLAAGAASSDAGAGGGPRLVIAALGALWGVELLVCAVAYAGGGWPAPLVAGQGVVTALAALVLGIAADRRGDWSVAISRPAALRSLAAVALAIYAGAVLAATRTIDAVGGANARLIEAAVVIGATTTLATLVSNPWLRAWLRVKAAKHLFRHRYDYRAAWQRFSETLGQPGAGAAPLAERVVRAMAELTDSPAGLLLVAEGGALEVAAGWRWPEPLPDTAGEQPLAAYLGASGRIVELDAVRARTAPAAETAAVPDWMCTAGEAWALVPLAHAGALAGAILLARPPIDRSLDWEDYDLLRVAGRQAASCLAEDRAHAALADAARFDEFNRRFAFIMHDIKNLVSQLSLVARNAERHADNPDFRTDMVATLKDSSGRLQALLARLSQHSGERAEPLQPVDVAALLARVAGSRRERAVIGGGDHGALALAQPGRLETVLGHLVQNAIDASPAGVPVELSASRDGAWLAVAVADHGEGMSAAFVRDQLFRPFASTKPGGFGLGAFEARQLVEDMGGRVEVSSREGEGTCFRLLLPLAPALETAA